MVKRLEHFNNLTAQDAVDWCLQRGLDPNAVVLSGGHFKWESPQTDEELARWEQYGREQAERNERWERETYERLKKKFNQPSFEIITRPRYLEANGYAKKEVKIFRRDGNWCTGTKEIWEQDWFEMILPYLIDQFNDEQCDVIYLRNNEGQEDYEFERR